MFQTTTPNIWSQKGTVCVSVPEQRNLFRNTSQNTQTSTNLEKFFHKLMLPGIEPGTSLSSAHSVNYCDTGIVAYIY